MRAALLFLASVASCYAHSLVLCVDWDGKSKQCNEDALPYHENFDGTLAYYHKQEGPLCAPASSVDDGELGRAKSPASAPYTVQAGSEVTLVWPANNHALINTPDSPQTSNQDVFLYHSYTNDPDDTLFSTTPLVSFYFGNRYEGGSFDMLASGSFANPYCTGTFTIPTDWEEGVHTLVWAWKMAYSFSLTPDGRLGGDAWAQNENNPRDMNGPHVNYVICFQYNVENPNGGTIKATRSQPELDFSPKLHDVVQLDDEIKDAGGQGRSYSAEAPQATSANAKPSTSVNSDAVKAQVEDSDSQALLEDDAGASKVEEDEQQPVTRSVAPTQTSRKQIATQEAVTVATGRSGWTRWSGFGDSDGPRYNRHQEASGQEAAVKSEAPTADSYAATEGVQAMKLSGSGHAVQASLLGSILGGLSALWVIL